MRRFLFAGVALSMLVAVGCGKSPAEKRAEELQKNTDQISKSAQQMAKGFEDMAKGLQGDPNQKAVEPASISNLQTAFAPISGWEMGKLKGEKMSTPVNFSEASVTYTKGDSRIEAKIVDSAFNQLLLLPFQMFLTAGYEKQTDDGYEKSVKVGENPGWEKWNGGSKSGELNLVVNKRFVVTLEGSEIADAKVLYQAANAMDLKKLAAIQ